MQGAKRFWTRFSDELLQFAYPRQCALCTQIGAEAVCHVCASEMRKLPAMTTAGDSVLSFQCSVFEYEGRAAQAVRRLKYSRSTSLAPFMAAQIREFAEEADILNDWTFVPVPLHWTRRCARGFNQAELLCQALPAEQVRTDLLVRTRATVPQARLGATARSRNLEGAFRATRDLAGPRVVLIDDVLTTGQTGKECAKALFSAGIQEVGLLTFSVDL